MPLLPVTAAIESYFGQPKGQQVLIIGCGHSEIPAKMHAMGYRCITAADISATLVTMMQQQSEHMEGLECERPVYLRQKRT